MPPIQTTIACPNCRRPVTAEVQQLFDVSQDPADKQRFLRGGFNMIRCPNCGYQGSAATPVVYHDADKELLMVHVPMEIVLPKPEQEKLIGRLINQAINALPPERRKAYLFQPQTMLSLQSMTERVLEGEGITREVLDTQRQKMSLLQEILRTPPDQLPALLQARDAELDETFFQLLSTSAAAAAAGGDNGTARRLSDVNQVLLQNSSYGKEILAQAQEAEAAAKDLQALGKNLTLDKFMDLVVKAKSEHRVTALVSLMRPAVDYQFFQALTERIDRAKDDEKTRLSKLRDRILDLTKEIDEATRQRASQAAEVLRAILVAQDPEQAIEENLPAIDDTFMAVLSANLDAAEKAGRRDVVERLTTIGNLIMQMLSQSAPPEIQFVNELLERESDEEAEALLRARAAEMTEAHLDAMRYVASSLRENNQNETADRLDKLQAAAVRQSMASKWKKGSS